MSTCPKRIQVAVLEDDIACRSALEQAIKDAPDMHLCWSVGNRQDALEQLHQASSKACLQACTPDVLLVDLGLPDGSGLDVIRECRASCPQALAMVSTIFGDEVHVLSAIEAGAMGYLLKDLSTAQVLDELRSLHAGGSPINPMVARKLLTRQFDPAGSAGSGGVDEPIVPTIPLSSRESEVLRMVARGHTIEEVARSLGVSRHTVRSFVRRIYDKLQVTTRAQAVHAAARQGLLKEDGRAR